MGKKRSFTPTFDRDQCLMTGEETLVCHYPEITSGGASEEEGLNDKMIVFHLNVLQKEIITFDENPFFLEYHVRSSVKKPQVAAAVTSEASASSGGSGGSGGGSKKKSVDTGGEEETSWTWVDGQERATTEGFPQQGALAFLKYFSIWLNGTELCNSCVSTHFRLIDQLSRIFSRKEEDFYYENDLPLMKAAPADTLAFTVLNEKLDCRSDAGDKNRKRRMAFGMNFAPPFSLRSFNLDNSSKRGIVLTPNDKLTIQLRFCSLKESTSHFFRKSIQTDQMMKDEDLSPSEFTCPTLQFVPDNLTLVARHKRLNENIPKSNLSFRVYQPYLRSMLLPQGSDTLRWDLTLPEQTCKFGFLVFLKSSTFLPVDNKSSELKFVFPPGLCDVRVWTSSREWPILDIRSLQDGKIQSVSKMQYFRHLMKKCFPDHQRSYKFEDFFPNPGTTTASTPKRQSFLQALYIDLPSYQTTSSLHMEFYFKENQNLTNLYVFYCSEMINVLRLNQSLKQIAYVR